MITNWPGWNRNHDLRMKEINVLGALGRSKLPGYKVIALLQEYKDAERIFKEEKLEKGGYMAILDRIIKQAKAKKKKTCNHSRSQRALNVAQNQCNDCGFIIGEEPKTKEEWDAALRAEVEGLCYGDRT